MTRHLLFLIPLMCAFAAPADAPRYTASGALMLPSDYREWIFLSAGSGMNYGAAAESANPPFENVFVNRSAYDAFRKSGQWPEKTAFILEIRSSESKGSINVGGHYQTAISGIEAEVKDGGKWTFYGFGAGATEGNPFARTERCYSCHSEHGAVDNTFVQFYPTLLPIARSKGTLTAA
ncbi:MAG: cytochrome P460 family protein, partial [Acidobacteriota bacterium]|nr:cytochrome P460 family protein [Acidobacteriota bacterium]